MNTWRNLPGKIKIAVASLDPGLRRRAVEAAEALSPEEAEIFLAMTRYDLAHSLAVAGRLRDDPTLYKAAILHDAGKLRGELGLLARWLYTGLEIVAPSYLSRLLDGVESEAAGEGAMPGLRYLPRGLGRGLYIQMHHAEIAADLLSRTGCEEEVVRLVRSHQEEPRDEMERRLREADDLL